MYFFQHNVNLLKIRYFFSVFRNLQFKMFVVLFVSVIWNFAQVIPILFDVDESRAMETYVKNSPRLDRRQVSLAYVCHQFISERGKKRNIIIHEK